MLGTFKILRKVEGFVDIKNGKDAGQKKKRYSLLVDSGEGEFWASMWGGIEADMIREGDTHRLDLTSNDVNGKVYKNLAPVPQEKPAGQRQTFGVPTVSKDPLSTKLDAMAMDIKEILALLTQPQ